MVYTKTSHHPRHASVINRSNAQYNSPNQLVTKHFKTFIIIMWCACLKMVNLWNLIIPDPPKSCWCFCNNLCAMVNSRKRTRNKPRAINRYLCYHLMRVSKHNLRKQVKIRSPRTIKGWVKNWKLRSWARKARFFMDVHYSRAILCSQPASGGSGQLARRRTLSRAGSV